MVDNEIMEVGEQFAVLEFTYNGEQGTVDSPVRFDLPDSSVVEMAQEALRSGDVTGITADNTADLTDYKVGRYPAKDGLPNRFSLRPKTPFGG